MRVAQVHGFDDAWGEGGVIGEIHGVDGKCQKSHDEDYHLSHDSPETPFR